MINGFSSLIVLCVCVYVVLHAHFNRAPWGFQFDCSLFFNSFFGVIRTLLKALIIWNLWFNPECVFFLHVPLTYYLLLVVHSKNTNNDWRSERWPMTINYSSDLLVFSLFFVVPRPFFSSPSLNSKTWNYTLHTLFVHFTDKQYGVRTKGLLHAQKRPCPIQLLELKTKAEKKTFHSYACHATEYDCIVITFKYND